jgi:hypothetical protein
VLERSFAIVIQTRGQEKNLVVDSDRISPPRKKKMGFVL